MGNIFRSCLKIILNFNLEHNDNKKGGLDAKQQQIGNGVTQAIGRFIKQHVLQALNANEEIVNFYSRDFRSLLV